MYPQLGGGDEEQLYSDLPRGEGQCIVFLEKATLAPTLRPLSSPTAFSEKRNLRESAPEMEAVSDAKQVRSGR
jgi:hypothetical protein